MAVNAVLTLEQVEPYVGPIEKPHLAESVWTQDYAGYRVACDCLADALHAATLPESIDSFVDWLVFCQRRG